MTISSTIEALSAVKLQNAVDNDSYAEGNFYYKVGFGRNHITTKITREGFLIKIDLKNVETGESYSRYHDLRQFASVSCIPV